MIETAEIAETAQKYKSKKKIILKSKFLLIYVLHFLAKNWTTCQSDYSKNRKIEQSVEYDWRKKSNKLLSLDQYLEQLVYAI